MTHSFVSSRSRIAIIGGGFSGATFAALLLRDASLPACDVTIVEPRRTLGCGIAYSAEDPLHRVNITAERMTALPDRLDDFDLWLRDGQRLALDPDATYPDYGTFPARALFGLYVDDLLRKSAAAAPHTTFRHLQTRVAEARCETGAYRLTCESGEVLEADLIVIATGHPQPRLLWPLSTLPTHPRLIADPWHANAVASIKPDDRVLIVGTGLTMGDMVASLRRRGHRAPITAISRRGLTPRPRSSKVTPIEDLDFTGRGQVSAVLQAVRRAMRQHAAKTGQWSDVFDSLRLQNSAIWMGWSEAEQRRFQRHLRPFWDVHRFQAAPQIHDLVSHEQAKGTLQIFAAAMTGAEIDGESIAITLRRRGTRSIETGRYDAVVNCTGASGPLIAENPVLNSLAAAGLIRPDVFGTGIDVDHQSRAVTRDGQTNEKILVLGPPIRGCLGEISGALEIATHAQAVAKALLARLNTQTTSA